MIKASNLSLSLSGQAILHDIQLQVKPGEVVALCGPNGAGKSSLLSCLAGEHPSCNPHISYAGITLDQLNPQQQAQRRVFLEQSPSLAAEFTLTELIQLGAPMDLPPDALARMVEAMIEEFDFMAMRDKLVSALSGGQRHRAHLARVLIQLRANRILGHESYLFLDEPTASLDMGYQIKILKLMRDVANQGVGVLVVLHDLNLAAAFADRMVLLRQGRIAYADVPEQVLTQENLTEVYETPIFVERAQNQQIIIQPVL